MSRISAELRRRVAESARFRCGYCLTPQRIVGPVLEIEHIAPQARGGADDEENLWVAYGFCNRRKADRLYVTDPNTNELVPLFNPRLDAWSDHFIWDEDGTLIRGTTPVG